MLNRLATRFKPLQRLYTKRSTSLISGNNCGLTIGQGYISLAQTIINKSGLSLPIADSVPYQPDNLISTLHSLVKKYNLSNSNCNLVLQKEDYQLLLLDALPVPQSEFQEAIRWKIKELINFPIDDAVIDSFDIPDPKTANAKKMIAVAVAQSSLLKNKIIELDEAGLKLTSIGIPELALRNITSLYENDEKNSSLIYLLEEDSQLVITSQKKLYFYRTMDLPLHNLATLNQLDPLQDNHELLDMFALEIQRSFDYFQSQWRQPMPSRVFLATRFENPELISHYLTARLAVSITLLDLREKIKMPNELSPSKQGPCLLAIGGVCQNEGGLENASTD